MYLKFFHLSSSFCFTTARPNSSHLHQKYVRLALEKPELPPSNFLCLSHVAPVGHQVHNYDLVLLLEGEARNICIKNADVRSQTFPKPNNTIQALKGRPKKPNTHAPCHKTCYATIRQVSVPLLHLGLVASRGRSQPYHTPSPGQVGRSLEEIPTGTL